MQFNMGKIDEQLFTPDARAMLSISEIQKRLNAFSLPAAIINSSELVGISRENNERVYRYSAHRLRQFTSLHNEARTRREDFSDQCESAVSNNCWGGPSQAPVFF
jgi:hypothetical protein